MPATDFPAPPLASATPETYAAIRRGLEDAGYSQPAISEHLGLRRFADLFEGLAPSEFGLAIDSPLSALCQVFLLGRAASRALLLAQLGDAFVEACRETGLLIPSDEAPDAWTASAALYPLEEIWVASDRVVPLPGLEGRAQPDVVYPAATRSGRMFLTLLPRRACGRFLEVCAGCGPAAVIATDFADEVTASDIAPRSAAFAAFNAALQHADRFQSVAGSCFEGTNGEYDCIAAHPPYVPSMSSETTYYGGGKDGTEVLRGLLAGLPEKLAPGGIFYAVAMIPQGPGATLMANVRRWIGEEAAQFDVFSFPFVTTSIHDMALSAAVKSGRGMDELFSFKRAWAAMGHAEYVLGALLVRRHKGEETAVDCQRKLASRTGWRELMWCLNWEQMTKEAGVLDALMQHPLQVRPEFELHALHKPSPEGLPPVEFRALTQYPFSMESQIQDWMSYLFARADGSMTGAQLRGSLIADQLLHPDTPERVFAQLLCTFVSGGFLESPICPLPEAAE